MIQLPPVLSLPRICSLLALMVSVPTTSLAEQFGDFTYSLNEGKATITDYPDSASGPVVVPASIDSHPVTRIGPNAFANCGSITSVTIPEGVSEIAFGAFVRCTMMKSISIPQSVETIGELAFSRSGLTSLSLPAGFTAIPESLCSYSRDLESVSLPESLESVGRAAFAGCRKLNGVVLPDGVTEIGQSAFSSTGLTSFSLPPGLTAIPEGLFSDCSDLEVISIPEGLESVGNFAFSGCGKLSGIVLPDGVSTIGQGAFAGCTTLNAIAVPNGVLRIERSVFSACSSLEAVTLPDTVVAIGGEAFRGCGSLATISLPPGLLRIESGAFIGCRSLEEISIPAGVRSLPSMVFMGCSNLARVELPQGLTYIGDSTFRDCISLSEIALPASLEVIDDSAFYVCTALTSITLPEGLRAINDSSFGYCNSLGPILLPRSLEYIGRTPFEGCDSLSSIDVPDGSENFTSIDGVLFRPDLTLLIYPPGREDRLYPLPDSCPGIGAYAFYRVPKLEILELHAGTRYFFANAIRECPLLRLIVVHGDAPLNPPNTGPALIHRSDRFGFDQWPWTELQTVSAAADEWEAVLWAVRLGYPPSADLHLKTGTHEITLADAYAHGVDPDDPDPDLIPSFEFGDETIGVRFHAANHRVTYHVETSPDGVTWSDTGVTTSELDPVSGIRTARASASDDLREIRVRVELDPLGGWLQSHELPLDASWDGDHDGDGVTLDLEHALGLDPNVPDSALLPSPQSGPEGMMIRFFASAPGSALSMSRSHDLEFWELADLSGAPLDSEGYRSFKFSTAEGPGFVRFEATPLKN